jgi:hypothetical protein
MEAKKREDLERAVMAKLGTREGGAIVAALGELTRYHAAELLGKASGEQSARATALEQAVTSTRDELEELRTECTRLRGHIEDLRVEQARWRFVKIHGAAALENSTFPLESISTASATPEKGGEG